MGGLWDQGTGGPEDNFVPILLCYDIVMFWDRKLGTANRRETNHEWTQMNTNRMREKRSANSVDFLEIRVYSCSFVVLCFSL